MTIDMPNGDAPQDRHDREVWTLTAGMADEMAGRRLTDDQLDRLAEAIQHSSIPEALDLIIYSLAGEAPDDDDE